MTAGRLTGCTRLPTKCTKNIVLHVVVYRLLLIAFNAGNRRVLQRSQDWFWGI